MEIGEEIEITEFNKEEFFDMAAKGEWNKVVDIYRKFPEAHKAKSRSSGDTAVHIAVSQQGKEEIVKQLVDQIRSPKGGGKEALEIKNNQGNTPLHVAVSTGNVRMCECIAQAYPSLVGVGNANRQTPIFLALQDGKQDIFLTLVWKAAEGDTPEKDGKEGKEEKDGKDGKEGKEEKDGKDITEESMISNVLFQMAVKGKWEEVVNIYQWTPLAHKVKITKSGDTALHIAVSHGNEEIVEQLIAEIISPQGGSKEALKIRNKIGNTALHVAASMGSVGMCQCIAKVDPLLVGVRNEDGETPFFLAAVHGKKEAFLRLLDVCGSKDTCEVYSRRNNGDTILHVAVNGDYFDLAYQIIHLYPKLVDSVDEDGFAPLHLLAGNPSNFKSASNLGLCTSIIYQYCIFVGQLQVDPKIKDASSDQPANDEHIPKCLESIFTTTCIDTIPDGSDQVTNGARERQLFPHNYVTCFEFLKLSYKAVLVIFGLGSQVTNRARRRQLFPLNYVAVFEFLKLLFKPVLFVLGLGYAQMKQIVDMKQKHTWSVQILNELVTRASSYEYIYGNTGTTPSPEWESRADEIGRQFSSGEGREGEDKNEEGKGIRKVVETPILIAAKNGITEIVEKILEHFPFAIDDVNKEKKNIVLLAVENRQSHIYKFLLEQKNMRGSEFQAVDNEGNSALHLAAKFGEYNIASAMSKLQWDFKWYEFVKESRPPSFFPRYNRQHKTPEDLFTETHKELVEQRDELLIKTSESCSIIAGLIATVAFATSVTVPGGVNQNSGTPMLVNEPAFNVFAISSLVALFFSIMAVVTFHVAILKSRCQKQVMGSTSIKFLVGSTSLLVSIAAMLISFCAGHYLMLRDKLRHAAIPMYAVAGLPIMFYTMVLFSFYFDLIRANFNKVPARTYKADSL
ncbi:hypothetical protein FH972_026940 [Carpinus fangiana]|uniref:PGG domain-containing protein n=1 Tax=Carpinus fangiana TaxID=176857 RepID=A0A5N6L5U2_9ROSI|nr:hypothetical protein FH972_026940 [Carpinus fangiana]